MLKPRYIMVGGFLGAGKTTAILKAAELLQARGERVGLITNDQSYGLVDTAMLNSHGFATEEITGGCFCCKFNSLVEAADKLNETTQPNMFIAEPVGSCTDLRSTVSYPLTQMYGDNFTIAPLSVLVDPVRAQQILGLKSGKTFSQKVLYIYEKQLEEADIIVVNKSDHPMTDTMIREVRGALSLAHTPGGWRVPILRTEAARGEGIEELAAKVAEHRAFIEAEGTLAERRARNLRSEVLGLATARLRRRLEAAIEDDPGVVELLNRVVSRELDPASAAAELLEGEIDE